MIEYDAKNIRTWSMLGAGGTFGLAACELANQYTNFAVLTADLCFYSGLERYKSQFPDRLYNVGIAEQNMIGVAAGMVNEGMNVFASTYATFASTRALDQVKVNMGYMGIPIKLIGLTSGLSVGILGATHMSLEDMAIMRAIPNITVISPADCTETMKAIMAAAVYEGPIYIRMTGTMRMPIVYKEDYYFEIGKAVKLKDGDDISILATGSMVHEALLAADILREKGMSCEVYDIHTIKPIDEEAVQAACKKKLIVTIEEHSRIGGLGAAVSELIVSQLIKPPLLIIGVDDYYPHAANYEHLINQCGLSEDSIVEKITEFYAYKC